MTKKNMRAKYFKIAVVVLGLLIASGNVVLTKRIVRAQGPDLAGMDKSVRPGDDFFDYANGGWLKATEIPPDRAGWGVFAELNESTISRTRTLIEGASNLEPGTTGRKTYDYYIAYFDQSPLQKKGMTPMKPILDRVAAIKD